MSKSISIFDSSREPERVPASETYETGVLGEVIEAIKKIYDPEIPVNLYDLGLIYHINLLEQETFVSIDMTLTNAACPVADQLIEQVQQAAASVETIKRVEVKLVWEPKWSRDNMCEEAQLHLGFI